MKISLKYKIFLSISVLLLAAIGSMVLLLQESFDRTFLQYVNEYEREAQKNLIASLGDLYHQHDSWDFIRENQPLWNRLVVSNFARAKINNGLDDDQKIEDLLNGLPDDGDERQMSKGERRFYRSNVALLDAERRLVIGRPIESEESEVTEFKVITNNRNTGDYRDNRDIVGYLAARPLARILETPDIEFSNQQIHGLYIVALGTALLTFLLSIPLARYLVTRINKLADGTRELTSGNFGVRIPDASEDELGKLSHDFNVLARTLEENEKARCQWIADISHELRTPLSILRGEIEAIQDKVRQLTPESLDNLHAEVLNLDRLVRDLYELSMSDIGALSYHKQKLDILDVLGQSVSIYREDFQQKNIHLELKWPHNVPIYVHADRSRISQLFTNLLTNSLRYTEDGGLLEIRAVVKPGLVEIEFNDSEPSVSEEDLPRLFDRLYRVESSRSRVTGGTGLGLAICKNIVEAHHGTITAGPSPRGGLQIKIEIPLA